MQHHPLIIRFANTPQSDVEIDFPRYSRRLLR